MRIELPPSLRTPAALSALFEAPCIKCGDPSVQIGGISQDTREICPGDFFLALQGERCDGHVYVQDALAKGASALLVREEFPLPSGNYWCFACKDVAQALLLAAKNYRMRIDARVIAVTGSVGKTTAKEAIAAVLGGVPHSEGNYNSTVGMPLSVLSFPSAVAWVCELGINHAGEMKKMTEALCPDVGVITNVGSAHIGHFGTYEHLLAQKASIAKGIRPGGALLVPHGLKPLVSDGACRVFSFGEGADFSVENIFMDENGVRCDFRTPHRCITNLVWPIPGEIGRSAILVAGAVGALLGRSDQQIRSGLLKAGKRSPRIKIFRAGERLVMEDCYNASPEAVLAAFESLGYLSGGRARVAVLGDMLELGEHSRFLHYTLGKALVKKGLYALFTVGCAAYEIARGAKESGLPAERIRCFAADEMQGLAKAVLRETPSSAAILIKASHAMHLERVSEEIRRMS